MQLKQFGKSVECKNISTILYIQYLVELELSPSFKC